MVAAEVPPKTEESEPLTTQPEGSGEKDQTFKGCRGCLTTLFIVLCVIAAGGYLLYHLEIHSFTIISPCGKYRVEVYYYLGESFIPRGPGSGSDKAGCVYIYRQADNKKLHREELPMEFIAYEIQFSHEADGSYVVYEPSWLWFELEKGTPDP